MMLVITFEQNLLFYHFCSFLNCKFDVVVLSIKYFQKRIAIIIIIKNTKYVSMYFKHNLCKLMDLSAKIFSSKCSKSKFAIVGPKGEPIVTPSRHLFYDPPMLNHTF